MLGAIIGDIVGSRFEFDNTFDYHFELFTKKCDFTDDSICTIAIADAILNKKDYQDALLEWCRKYPHPKGAYGGSFARWIVSANPQPYHSFGNGSAMRVSAVGWLFDNEEDVLEEAKKSAAVTHNHPEGIKGAQAVALAILVARQGRGLEAIKQVAFDFYGKDFEQHLIPEGYFDETCQGTVPVAFHLIGQSHSFEDAIRRAISYGGDSDTLGAIVGAIAEALWGIPEDLRVKALDYLPEDMVAIVHQARLPKI